MSNGIYDILGKLASLAPKEEAAKTEPQKIYESVEAKGSILEGVKGIEQRLSEDYASMGTGMGAQGGVVGEDPMGDVEGGTVAEVAAPGQESWIKKNKQRFIDQYGKDKGLEVLYATAWKRSKKEESIKESDFGWDHKEEKTPTVRKVTGKYGTEYQGDPDEDDEEQRKIDTGTRSRGRPRKHAVKAPKLSATGEKLGRGRPKKEKPAFSGKNAAGALTNILFGKAPKLSGKGRVHRMDESRMLDEAGESFNHILNRFKSEVKAFEQGQDLDQDLYDALYDYYVDVAEMPYGVQKARTGDPYDWVTNKLDDYLISQGVDKWEGVEECGATTAGAVAIAPERSLEEEMADLVELAKLAGIETEGNAFGAAVRNAKADGIQPGEKVKVGGEEYPVKEADTPVEEPVEEPVNAPKKKYFSMKGSTMNPGEGDAGEKQMNPDRPTFKNGDNALSRPPVRESDITLEAKLAAEYESIKKVSK